MDLIKKAKVRQFIKENGKHITQIESTFYTALEVKVENMILGAITNNASRRRLTQYELVGGNGNGGKTNGKESH